MQVLSQHKKTALISLLIVVILIVSAVVLVQNHPSPSTNPSTTPTLTPLPSQNSPNPTSTSIATSSGTPSPTTQHMSTPTPYVFPDEVTQYQGQNLTLVSTYIQYLIEHPDVAIKGAQTLDKATYKLSITGMVNNPTNYTYNQVVGNFNSTLQVATLPCVEGWSVTLLWQGVPITELLHPLGVSQNANTLIFLAADGYSTSLPIDYVKQNNIMIAYKINNLTLTPQTGWPFFLVAKNQYGYKWIEWITEINVSNDSSYLGYWESRGYPNNATVQGINPTQPLLGASTVAATYIIGATVCATVVLFWYKTRKKQKLTVAPNYLQTRPALKQSFQFSGYHWLQV